MSHSSQISECDVVVVGAGIAGLTAAAILARAGLSVLVCERHNVAGGCASFYQSAGFRFDVGATVISGFGERGVHRNIFSQLGIALTPEPSEPAMIVHLPDVAVTRYGDARWQTERRRVFGSHYERFWQRQEALADAAWDFSRTLPALPVDLPSVLADLRGLRPHHVRLLGALDRTVASILPSTVSSRLRTFLDAQLLITAQTDVEGADLAYGVTALDLAREGTYHLPDGVGMLASALARNVRANGSQIWYNAEVRALERSGRHHTVELADGRTVRAKRVVAAVPLPNLVSLCADLGPAFRRRVAALPQRWGAFMLYVGLPPGLVPRDLPRHHQIVRRYGEPLGEGNSAFLSFSGDGETRRARGGGRAVTVSTHTDIALWERAAREGTVDALRADYERRLTEALERVVPHARSRAVVFESAMPHTFERYTGRARGLVGGLPQTPTHANLRAFSHRTPVRGLFLCGDNVFPGQSTVGATLSGNAAARAILAEV